MKLVFLCHFGIWIRFWHCNWYLGMSFAPTSRRVSFCLSLYSSLFFSHVNRKISFATWHKTLARRDKMNSDKLPNSSWAQSVAPSRRAMRWVNSNTMRLRLIFYNFAHDFQFLSASQANSGLWPWPESGPKWKFSLKAAALFPPIFYFLCVSSNSTQPAASRHAFEF